MNEDRLLGVRETMVKYAPRFLSVSGVTCLLEAAAVEAERRTKLTEAYERTNAEFARYKLTAIQDSHSNNWLKMHGYPMRRRKPN
jgi:hypothetical protein